MGLLGDTCSVKETHQKIVAGIKVEDNSDILLGDNPAEEANRSMLAMYVCPVQAVTWDRLQEKTVTDDALQEVSRMVVDGLPKTRHKMSDSSRDFFRVGSSYECL